MCAGARYSSGSSSKVDGESTVRNRWKKWDLFILMMDCYTIYCPIFTEQCGKWNLDHIKWIVSVISDRLLSTFIRSLLVQHWNIYTLAIALVSLPVIFLQILAASAVDAGGNSLITVFKPETSTVNSFTFRISIKWKLSVMLCLPKGILWKRPLTSIVPFFVQFWSGNQLLR